MTTTAVKALGNGIYGGYGVVFTDPDHPDLEGDFFNEQTDFWLDSVPTKALCFDHGLTPLPGDDDPAKAASTKSRYVIGDVVKREVRPEGLWFEFIMQEHSEYKEEIQALIDAGILAFSSDSISHYVERVPQKSGVNWIKSWPIPIISVTHRPAQPWGTGVSQLKNYLSQSDIETLGLEVPILEAAQSKAKGQTPTIQGKPTMKYNQLVIQGLLESHDVFEALKGKNLKEVEEFVEDTEAVKEEGDVVSVLRPVAEALAAAVGGTPEEALAAVVAYMTSRQAPVADAAMSMDEEGAYETEEVAMMSAGKSAPLNREALKTAMVAQRGAYVSIRPVVKSAEKPLRFTEFIRAVASKNHRKLDGIQAKSLAGYKALGINPDTAGGYLVPPEHSTEVIELLRATAIMLPIVKQLPMNRDILNIPKQTGAATAYWIGENSTIPTSQELFGQVTLTAKKLAVLVPISNELLADSDPSVDAVVREDIARQMANAVDSAILLGAGVGNVPLGLFNNPDVTQTASSNPTDYQDLVDMIARVEAANVSPVGNWEWVGHPLGKAVLRQLEDPAGQYIWTDSVGLGNQAVGPAPSTLLGYKWNQTTLSGLGGDGYSRLFFGNWSDLIVGLRAAIEIRASDEAGTAFAADQTWIRAIMRLDLVTAYTQSFQILTGVRS